MALRQMLLRKTTGLNTKLWPKLLDHYNVGKRAILSKDEMEKTIMSAMQVIQSKADLVKRFFHLPDTLYAKLPA